MSDKIEELSKWYGNVELDFDRELIGLRYRSIKKYFKGNSCLELGPAQGIMTKMLVNDFKKMTLVEGSQNLLNQIPDYPNVEKVHSTLEEFMSEKKFGTIILDHVLEHIEDPVTTLRHVRQYLKKGGVFLIGVPNAKSLHRMLGVKMGALKSEYELNARDKELGHYRVYDIDQLNEHVKKAGFKVKANDGVFLKLVSNKQIQDNFTPEMKEGCYLLGKEFERTHRRDLLHRNDLNMIRQTIEGIKVRLRPFDESDAPYMVELRNKPENNKYLSNRGQTILLPDQLKWMQSQDKRGDCVNFIVELKDGNKKVGNIAIYDIEHNEAELGRYICENAIGTIESEYLCLKYVFEILGLKKLYCKTVKRNEKVWQQHFKYGFIKEGEDYDDRISEERVVQTITPEQFNSFDYSAILNILKRF